MRRALAFLLLLAPAAAYAEARLPGGVSPTEIRVAIEPDANALKFSGTVTLQVQVDKTLGAIVMNAADLKIARATIDGAKAKATLDEDAETLTLTTGKKLARGSHKIEIAYEGTIKQQPAGLFAVDYPVKTGGSKRMLATQFEATDARRMLPCFDEPAYKAKYHVTVTAPKKQLAISNMPSTRSTDLPDGRVRVEFAPTPQMSSYLLFLAVGEFETISQRVDGRTLRVVTVEGEAAKGKFALDLAARLLPFYENYFAQRYPLPKLDLFAVPASGGFGAMENWGALLFFDRWVLFDPAINAEAARQGVAVTVAHEMAHQWFGNLVTMGWWDDLWLNEGFASWMENHSVDALLPAWQIWLQTRRERETAMRLDARRGSHPVVQKVESANEANAAFDDITYRKGQTIVRMLEAWLGADPFRTGMRTWMHDHAYGVATTEDLWTALERVSKFPVREVATSFTSQAGLPLIEAAARCESGRTKLTLSQSRFSAGDATPRPHTWLIPLVLQPLGGKPTRILLRDARDAFDLPGCAPVVVNAGGITWARVTYAPETRAALTERFAELDAADQVMLLDDSWALVETGKLPADTYLALVAQLKPKAPLPVWQQVSETFAEIDGWLRDTPGRASLRNFARGKLGPALARLGWSAKPNEPTTDSLLRDVLIDALSSLDDRPAIDEAKRRFHAWADNGAELPGSIRGVVLRAAGRGADAGEFDLLLAKAQGEADRAQQQNLLTALAGVRNPQLAQRVLDVSLQDWVPPTSRSSLVVQVAQAGEHAGLAWNFAQAHYEKLVEPLDLDREMGFRRVDRGGVVRCGARARAARIYRNHAFRPTHGSRCSASSKKSRSVPTKRAGLQRTSNDGLPRIRERRELRMKMLVAALLSLSVASAAQAAPESRLPDTVRPLDYKVEIAPDATGFQGKVEIQFETTTSITTLTLHAADLTFDTAEIDGVAAEVAVDPRDLHAAGPGHARQARRQIRLSRQDRRQRLRPVRVDCSVARRRQKACAGDAIRIVPAHAACCPALTSRVSKPCSTSPRSCRRDEVAISNMPIENVTPEDGRKRVSFAVTPRMSTYLLFLAVGDYESVEGQAGNTKVAIWTPRGAIHRAQYALDATIEVLTWFGDYFALPYPLPKLGHGGDADRARRDGELGAIRFPTPICWSTTAPRSSANSKSGR